MTSRTTILRGRAFKLEYATIAWNVVEGGAALAAGFLAGSVALVAFGRDSAVEVVASAIVVWELRGADRRRERRAVRAIGAAYLVVAVYVLLDAANSLRIANHPEASPLGMVLLGATVVVMLGLGVAKLRVGRTIDSQTVIADGRFSLVDGSLAGAVLAGLLLSALLSWWWADAVLAIVIALLAFREGREGLFSDDDDATRPEEPVGSQAAISEPADSPSVQE
jgi:divalent metal cation (Fe/Co/Zn/Cd) transporter